MNLNMDKLFLLLINILGGGAVIASYIHGFMTHPGKWDALWGNLPQALKPLYTFSMFSAALGYLAFTAYLLLAVNPDEATIAHRFSYRLFPALFLLILVPSALWMPMTFSMIYAPSPAIWLCIRLALSLVGIGSIGMILSLVLLDHPSILWFHYLAIAGSIFFCIQTAILDALIWPYFFQS